MTETISHYTDFRTTKPFHRCTGFISVLCLTHAVLFVYLPFHSVVNRTKCNYFLECKELCMGWTDRTAGSGYCDDRHYRRFMASYQR